MKKCSFRVREEPGNEVAPDARGASTHYEPYERERVYRCLALLFVFRRFRPAPDRRRFRKMQAGSAPLVQRRARSGVRRLTTDAARHPGGARAQAPAADASRIHAQQSGAVKAAATWLDTAIRGSTAPDAARHASVGSPRSVTQARTSHQPFVDSIREVAATPDPALTTRITRARRTWF
jgi:hypothetical protein